MEVKQGDMSNLFVDFSNETNRLILENSTSQSSSQVPLSGHQKALIIAYPDTIICK